MTFDELIASAATIVRGEVTGVRSTWRDRGAESPIITFVTLRVHATLKGVSSTQLLLEFLGGTVGDQTLTISDMPQFRVGDRSILFIDDAGRPASPIVGFFMGRFPIHVDAFTGREFVTTFDGAPFSDPATFTRLRANSLADIRAPSPGAALSVAAVESLIRERLRPRR